MVGERRQLDEGIESRSSARRTLSGHGDVGNLPDPVRVLLPEAHPRPGLEQSVGSVAGTRA